MVKKELLDVLDVGIKSQVLIKYNPQTSGNQSNIIKSNYVSR